MTSLNPKPWAKFYGTTRWERRSKLNLRMHPLCAECKRQGRTKEANLSHHLEEWQPNFGEYQFWYGPLESACYECHAKHHGFNTKTHDFDTAIGVDGWPIDPMHDVYRSTTARRENSNEIE
jgi:5-methylcytosine-specific restriction enzyme A